MRKLTIQNLPPAVAEALEREKRRRGTSLNQTVIDLLKPSLGISDIRSTGLRRFAGQWSEEEFEAFQEAVSAFETIDPELWG